MWKDIQGFEGLYSINENGEVYSIKHDLIMKPYISNKGYKLIDLVRDGKKYKFSVHRLVALHFVPNPNNYPIVLHKDNIKLNTHYSNLQWGTYSENNAQAIRDGLNTVPKPDNRKYYRVFNNDGFSKVFKGTNEIIESGNYGTECIMRNTLFRHNELKGGLYEGCKIERTEIVSPVKFI